MQSNENNVHIDQRFIRKNDTTYHCETWKDVTKRFISEQYNQQRRKDLYDKLGRYFRINVYSE